MSGMLQLLASGGAGPTDFGGTISSYRFGASASSCTATLNTEGSIDGSWSGDSGSDTISSDNWYYPNLAGVGASYWVRATLSAGSTPSSGSGTGTWLQLNATRSWTYNSGTGGAVSSRSGTLLLEVSTSSGGTPVVCSGSISFDAERES